MHGVRGPRAPCLSLGPLCILGLTPRGSSAQRFPCLHPLPVGASGIDPLTYPLTPVLRLPRADVQGTVSDPNRPPPSELLVRLGAHAEENNVVIGVSDPGRRTRSAVRARWPRKCGEREVCESRSRSRSIPSSPPSRRPQSASGST